MKKSDLRFVLLFLAITTFIACGPFHKGKPTGTELPAYESEKQHLVLRNLLNSKDYSNWQQLLVNGKEYPIKDIEQILDTIDPNYTIEIKNDSVANKQLLILKTQP